MKKLLLLSLLLVSSHVHADGVLIRGHAFVPKCEAAVTYFDTHEEVYSGFANVCLFFIHGVTESLRSLEMLDGKQARICRFAYFGGEPAARAVIEYAEQNPESLDWPAIDLVLAVMKSKYPCQ